MNRLKMFLYCIPILLIIGCSSPPKPVKNELLGQVPTDCPIINLTDALEDQDPISVKGVVDSISYVQLDNWTKLPAYPSILDMAITKDYIFILGGIKSGVFKYNRQGELIRKIVPNPDTSSDLILAIGVDEAKQLLYMDVGCGTEGTTEVYDYEGKHQGNISEVYGLPRASQNVYRLGENRLAAFSPWTMLLGDKKYFGAAIFADGGEMLHQVKYLAAPDTLSMTSLGVSNYQADGSILLHSHIGSRASYVRPYTTLYKMTADSIFPMYHFYDGNTIDKVHTFQEIRFGFFNLLIETDSMLYVSYRHHQPPSDGLVAYNKKAGTFRSMIHLESETGWLGGYANHLDGTIPIRFTYSFPRQRMYVAVITSKDISLLRKRKHITAESNEVIRKHKEGDNPILIGYYY